MTRAIIFANGDIGEPDFVKSLACDGDTIIAADGGLRHAMALGFSPSVVVGDLDSAPNELVQLAQRTGAEIIRQPVRKDKTDLELALELAAARGAGEILIFGALGGRLDHALANVLLVTTFSSPDVSVLVVESAYELLATCSETVLKGKAGDLVTLLALTDSVTGITTEGLEYPLSNEALNRGSSRGVSNVMVSDEVTITVAEGTLLIVHLRDSQAEE